MSKTRNSTKPGERRLPRERRGDHRDAHAHDFVDDDRTGVGRAECALGLGGRPGAGRRATPQAERHFCRPRPAPAARSAHHTSETHRRTDRARRDREEAGVAGAGNGERRRRPRHVTTFTTRVRRRRSRAGRVRRPVEERRQEPAPQRRRPPAQRHRARSAAVPGSRARRGHDAAPRGHLAQGLAAVGREDRQVGHVQSSRNAPSGTSGTVADVAIVQSGQLRRQIDDRQRRLPPSTTRSTTPASRRAPARRRPRRRGRPRPRLTARPRRSVQQYVVARPARDLRSSARRCAAVRWARRTASGVPRRRRSVGEAIGAVREARGRSRSRHRVVRSPSVDDAQAS